MASAWRQHKQPKSRLQAPCLVVTMKEGRDFSCAWRRVVYECSDGYKLAFPVAASSADALEGILHPRRPQVKEGEVVTAGVRDIRKLKQIRAKSATGCPKCAAYRSVRSCAYLRRDFQYF
eukprot:TRINITY_DN13960_c0_g2_i1.p1 TRINITY_DN13960_c0_g2~~TRINITY_DN13960_c0_g2_i1.p1  ORF type:complete len:129 (+),score=3.57 TRINITY_DN13960_c0_g2_i1:28-387(+)